MNRRTLLRGAAATLAVPLADNGNRLHARQAARPHERAANHSVPRMMAGFESRGQRMLRLAAQS